MKRLENYSECLRAKIHMRNRTANRVSILALFSAAILVALVACRSVALLDEPAPLTEVTREQIERNISDGNPFAAIQDLDLLKRAGSEIPPLQLEVLHKNAAEALKTMFTESLEAKDYGKALSIFRSATSLSGGDEYEGWKQANLISELAKGLLKKGDTVAAYLTFSQALQTGEVPSEDARIFLESAIAGAYTPLVEQLIADGVKH